MSLSVSRDKSGVDVLRRKGRPAAKDRKYEREKKEGEGRERRRRWWSGRGRYVSCAVGRARARATDGACGGDCRFGVAMVNHTRYKFENASPGVPRRPPERCAGMRIMLSHHSSASSAADPLCLLLPRPHSLPVRARTPHACRSPVVSLTPVSFTQTYTLPSAADDNQRSSRNRPIIRVWTWAAGCLEHRCALVSSFSSTPAAHRPHLRSFIFDPTVSATALVLNTDVMLCAVSRAFARLLVFLFNAVAVYSIHRRRRLSTSSFHTARQTYMSCDAPRRPYRGTDAWLLCEDVSSTGIVIVSSPFNCTRTARCPTRRVSLI